MLKTVFLVLALAGLSAIGSAWSDDTRWYIADLS
jgi:hypothetical protein